MFINQNGTADVENLRILKMGWNSSGSKTNCKCSFLDNIFFCFKSHGFVKFILCNNVWVVGGSSQEFTA